ncbi:MAG: hypothetical protein QG609_337 [Patescibacteria group bacterium]|jgi:hypothetical protein|nr:hypothetical protein [Patescibacteria group bacterium]
MSEKVSRKKWLKAIKLAESIAHDEQIINGNFECLKKGAEKGLKNKMRRAKNNPLAMALLPQARKITHQEEAREEAIKCTMLGHLRELIENQACNDPNFDEDLHIEDEIEIEALFYGGAGVEEILSQFKQDLKKGDLNVCLRDMLLLLNLAILEIRDTDLPPKASEYIYPHRPRTTSTSRYIN